MIQSLVNGNIFRVVIHAQLAAVKSLLDMKIAILDVLKVVSHCVLMDIFSHTNTIDVLNKKNANLVLQQLQQ
jgi:hypothetical protein